jgi:hypothetical protein
LLILTLAMAVPSITASCSVSTKLVEREPAGVLGRRFFFDPTEDSLY